MTTISLDLLEDALCGTNPTCFELLMMAAKESKYCIIEVLLKKFRFRDAIKACDFIIALRCCTIGPYDEDYKMIKGSLSLLDKKEMKFLLEVAFDLSFNWIWNCNVNTELKMQAIKGLDKEFEIRDAFLKDYEPDVEYEPEMEEYFLDAICERFGSCAPVRLLDVYYRPPNGKGWLEQVKKLNVSQEEYDKELERKVA